MSKRVLQYDPPVRAGVCRYCAEPIEATGRVIQPLEIRGLRTYLWRHVGGGLHCEVRTSAMPFDGWDATALVEGALAARDAIRNAMEAALAPAPPEDQ